MGIRQGYTQQTYRERGLHEGGAAQAAALPALHHAIAVQVAFVKANFQTRKSHFRFEG
jgi:hypothetical protein